MFDTFVRAPDVHHHNNVKIVQKPHDAADAARLYGEIADRAEKAIAGAAIERLGANNEVKIVKVATFSSIATCITRVRVLFSVNGYQYDFECEFDQERITSEVGRRIAEQVCDGAFRALSVTKTGDLIAKEQGKS